LGDKCFNQQAVKDDLPGIIRQVENAPGPGGSLPKLVQIAA